MTQEDYRTVILKREQDLLSEMDRNQSEARDMTEQPATEAMERMVNMEERNTLLQHNDSDYRELTQVRAALERLKDGTFGKCLDCDQTIPEGRLAAIPWTEYCIADQERHEQDGGQSSGSLTM